MQNIDEYKEAQNQLNAKAQEWKSQIDKRLAALETLKKQLNNERVLLTDELIKEREEEHQIIENEIIGLVITRKIEIEDAINKAVVNFVKKVSDSTVFVMYKTNLAVVSLRSVFVKYSKSIPKVFF